MAQITAPGNLQTAQAGNGDSTNTIYEAGGPWVDTGRGASIIIKATVGAAPTVTIDVLGSPDGTSWVNIPYFPSTAPNAYVTGQFSITAAGTTYLTLAPGRQCSYFKLLMSANNNVTLTSDYV